MNKPYLSRREWLIAGLLLLIFLAAVYHMAFRMPLQKELAAIEAQTLALDARLEEAVAQVAQMEKMRSHLQQIPSQTSQIAPFDNKEAVLQQLNRILSASEEYRLTFMEASPGSDGLVRRSVVMDFTCGDFSLAQDIIGQLSSGPWRCLVGNLALRGTPDVMSGAVTVSATVVYFESTLLTASRP